MTTENVSEKPARASGVSAAEKYAELEDRGEERPRCACHGEIQNWKKDTECLSGGRWSCKSSSSRYYYRDIEKSREKRRDSSKRAYHKDIEKSRQSVLLKGRILRNRRDQAQYDALAAKYPEIAALLNQTGGNE